MQKKLLLQLINWWPPFLGAGIKVKHIAPDFCTIQVEMKLRFWNKNYIGTQYGGSLYSMCDPFFMLILIENLGTNYVVLDKEGSIRYKKKATSKVHATFHISKEKIKAIQEQVDNDRKAEPFFRIDILDEHNAVIAEVDKIIYVRRKDFSI